jgi:outer membrane protein assembly factor BamE (lipoprotein component of BamABCDE complex)
MKNRNAWKPVLVCWALVLPVAVAGCVSYHGNKKITDPEITSQIKEGKTTKAEVEKLLGEPAHVSFDADDAPIWRYTYVRSESRGLTFIPYVGTLFGGADTQTKNMTIKFTKAGIVRVVGIGGTTGGGGGLQDQGK